MKDSPAGSDGWQLRLANDEDLTEVMTWFADAASVDIWGGPAFRFPFTQDSFRKDCRFEQMTSCALWNPAGRLAAFGQWYERDGRAHLARLIVNPGMRREGAGTRLIAALIAQIASEYDYEEYSLFVYRHNTPALGCYRRFGFDIREYPADAPMRDRCYFLTKARTEFDDDE